MKNFVSIVVPVFNEQENVRDLILAIDEVMQGVDHPYEIIFVNDGSRDDTWRLIEELSRTMPHLWGIDLAGNFGQTAALRAGFDAAKGEIIVAMDGDFQHDPRYIPQFIEHIEQGYDMVGGFKLNRPGNPIEAWLAGMAHRMICMISGVKMQYFGATFKAYRRFLLQDTNMLGDAHRFLGAILAKDGIRYMEFPIEINERRAGKSHYNLKKAFLVSIDLLFLKFLISYMKKPFRLFGIMGGFMSLVGLMGVLVYVVGSLFLGWKIKEHYMAEFMFHIFLVIVGLISVSFGIIAEIGIYGYYGSNGVKPYSVRQATPSKGDE